MSPRLRHVAVSAQRRVEKSRKCVEISVDQSVFSRLEQSKYSKDLDKKKTPLRCCWDHQADTHLVVKLKRIMLVSEIVEFIA